MVVRNQGVLKRGIRTLVVAFGMKRSALELEHEILDFTEQSTEPDFNIGALFTAIHSC